MRSFTHADLEICTRGPRLPGPDSAVVSIDTTVPASLRFAVCTDPEDLLGEAKGRMIVVDVDAC